LHHAERRPRHRVVEPRNDLAGFDVASFLNQDFPDDTAGRVLDLFAIRFDNERLELDDRPLQRRLALSIEIIGYLSQTIELFDGTPAESGSGLIRAMFAPLGIDFKCEGTCYGGWCREVPVPAELGATAYVCECSYFV
jgi:hypothetical protein